MGIFKAIKRKAENVLSPVLSFLGLNPLVSLGVSLFLAWILRPKVPEIEDFGTNEFDDFERGILLNKESIVGLQIVSNWADFEKKNGRKTNNTSQQRFFSGDLGMDFSSQTVQDIKWGRA